MKKGDLNFFLGPLIFVIIWQFIIFFNFAPEVLLPSPFRVVPYLITHLPTTLSTPTLETIKIWLIGVTGATLLGISCGALCGLSDKLYRSLEFSLDFLRSIPTMIYMPVATILVGFGTQAQLLVIIFVVSLYPTIEIYYGVKYGQLFRKKLARVYKMNTWTELTCLILPATIPHIISSVRLTINLSLIATIGTEMIMGGSHGLGRIILNSVVTYNLTEMYATICLVGILGYTANRIFLTFERRLTRWKTKTLN